MAKRKDKEVHLPDVVQNLAKLDAFAEGCQDFASGHTADYCPYHCGISRRAWMAGYYEERTAWFLRSFQKQHDLVFVGKPKEPE